MICGSISAQTNYQNQYSQFGNSYTTDENGNRIDRNGNRVDRDGNPIDTTAVIDANTIPIGIQSWTIDPRFGNSTEVPVDTLQHGFQNTNDTGGPTGHYTYLGNLGAPRIAHVFFERKEGNQFFFTDPYDFTVRQPEDIIYTNTKSPYTNLTYYKQETDVTVRNALKPILRRMSTGDWDLGLTLTIRTDEANTKASLLRCSMVTFSPIIWVTSITCILPLSTTT